MYDFLPHTKVGYREGVDSLVGSVLPGWELSRPGRGILGGVAGIDQPHEKNCHIEPGGSASGPGPVDKIRPVVDQYVVRGEVGMQQGVSGQEL